MDASFSVSGIALWHGNPNSRIAVDLSAQLARYKLDQEKEENSQARGVNRSFFATACRKMSSSSAANSLSSTLSWIWKSPRLYRLVSRSLT
jgi:hypothetical protein